MADRTVPYLDAGKAAFEELDTYMASFLTLGDYPPLVSTPIEMAAGTSFSQFQVVGRDGAGKLVPAVYSAPSFATLDLTFSGTGTDGDTVTINGVVYTLKDAITAV